MSKEEIKFDYGAIICPKCGVGRITSGIVSVSAFDASNHLEAHIHMKCPHCNERLLVQGDGTMIGYNFRENSCDRKRLVIIEE